MGKVEEFKSFVKNNPVLISYIKSGEMTWQKFYEIYDIYGEDDKVWDEYLTTTDNKDSSNDDKKSNNIFGNFENIVNTVKNIDVDKVQDGISSLQKALGLFGEIIGGSSNNSTGSVYQPRPLYRKFED